jgi:type II secretory ATPase GspE/PulE/Tfp pilus assembly ATPase PilB-like protein
METLADSALNKIFTGITSVEEVLRAIISEADEEDK